MENIDCKSGVLVKNSSQGSRKKFKKPTKREIAKNLRHSAPSGCNVFTPCKHNTKVFQCAKVRPQDALKYRKTLYCSSNKQLQDQKVSRLISHNGVKRQRSRTTNCLGLGLPQKSKPHSFSAHYMFPIANGNNVTVCKSFFLHLTTFKSDRVRQILRKLRHGEDFVENRGGDRVSQKSILKKNSVREFIGNLKGSESHYNRKKTKRVYLSSDLSIKKLWTIYNSSTTSDLKVTKSMFRRIFCTEFNVGFKSPASDICGYCAMMDNKIKNALPNEKSRLFSEKTVHKKRAKAFYDIMKESKDNDITFCFDMQQVQSLPRTPVQQAFYARQLSLYNICITDVDTRKPEFFMWSEEQAGRGSTEVGSALLSFLSAYQFEEHITHIRLFCDGCTGQNKNNHILHSLMYYLAKTEGNIQTISITFPVRGHSFLPADRVFGRVERLLKKKPTMVSKEEYFEEYKKVGTVRILGSDWRLQDLKSLGGKDGFLKPLAMISEKKRIFLSKNISSKGNVLVKVKANDFFRFEDESLKQLTLLKKGMNWATILKAPLGEVPLVHPITGAKKKDVDGLLKVLFGEEWTKDQTLSWYNDIIHGESTPTIEDEIDQPTCDCLEDDCALHI